VIGPPRDLPPPAARLRACVVVPARDEEELVERCLEGVGAQAGVAPGDFEMILVLDACSDRTEERARAVAAARPEPSLHLTEGPGGGSGPARRIGMDLACERLLAVGRPDGLIACTDADSVVAPSWLAAQLAAVTGGARAIGGRVEIRREDARRLGRRVLRLRAEQAAARHRALLAGAGARAGSPEHWQFSGASMALTAETYVQIGGIEPSAALEDEALERSLVRHGVPIARLSSVRVVTSGRTYGRAARGLAHDLARAKRLEEAP